MPDEIEVVAAASAAPAPAPEPTQTQEEPAAPIERNYAALDHYLPDSEDVPEPFRNKSIAEIARLGQQWRTEASSANEYNKRLNEERLQIAREMIASQRGDRPNAAPAQTREPVLYMASEDGQQAIPVSLSQLLGPMLQPIQQQLEEANFRTYQNDSERARAAARPANVPVAEWNELGPELGMYMGVRSMEPRNEASWKQAYNETYGRKQRINGGAAPAPTQGNAPAGNATSLPAATKANGMPRLTSEHQTQLDEIAGKLGVKKGSKTYVDIAKQVAADYRVGGR